MWGSRGRAAIGRGRVVRKASAAAAAVDSLPSRIWGFFLSLFLFLFLGGGNFWLAVLNDKWWVFMGNWAGG